MSTKTIGGSELVLNDSWFVINMFKSATADFFIVKIMKGKKYERATTNSKRINYYSPFTYPKLGVGLVKFQLQSLVVKQRI